MAQKVRVTQVSDISGEEAAETVRFALDGTEYEIDLAAAEAAQMRASVRPFTEHARKKGRTSRRGSRRSPSRGDLPDIREYARNRGYDISERGRVPQRIIEEYDLLKDYSSKQ